MEKFWLFYQVINTLERVLVREGIKPTWHGCHLLWMLCGGKRGFRRKITRQSWLQQSCSFWDRGMQPSLSTWEELRRNPTEFHGSLALNFQICEKKTAELMSLPQQTPGSYFVQSLQAPIFPRTPRFRSKLKSQYSVVLDGDFPFKCWVQAGKAGLSLLVPSLTSGPSYQGCEKVDSVPGFSHVMLHRWGKRYARHLRQGLYS